MAFLDNTGLERLWHHITAKLNAKANMADVDTALSTAQSYTDTAIADLINSAPTTLDTLGEIATAMSENEDVVEALEAAVGTKANASDLTSHTNNKNNPHGVTLSQLGVTATAAELNIMDGVTATAAEINKLDGLTATTAELNYVDGVTSNIQTQLDAKATTSNLNSHANDTTKHITAAERTAWNAAEGNAKAYTDEAVANIQIPNNIVTCTSLPCVLPAANNWQDIAYGDGKIIIVSQRNKAAVYDGTNWTLSNSSLPTNYPWQTVVYGDGKFVVFSTQISSKAMYSTDGISWTNCSSLSNEGYWESAIYANGMFVALDKMSSTQTASYSYNGINWQTATLPAIAGWKAIAYGNGVFAIAACTKEGNSSDSALAAYSTNGIDWQATSMPLEASWESMTYGNGKFVAVGTSYNSDYLSHVATSQDGVTWQESASFAYSGAAHIAHGDGVFVVQSGNTIKYSTDAITWFDASIDSTIEWADITYANNMFVVVGKNSNQVAFSLDGKHWYDAPTVLAQDGTDVKSMIINGLVNEERVNDAMLYKTSPIVLSTNTNWSSVTYGDGKFVAICKNSNIAAYSTNGIDWTEVTLPSTGVWSSVTYGDGKFVAICNNYSNVAAYSTDGISWTATTLPQNSYWCSVTYGNDKFVAIAGDFDYYNIAAYSTDGISWTKISLPISGQYTQVVYGNGMFVAASKNNRLVYSTNGGTKWQYNNTVPTNCRIIAYGNNKFVALQPNSNTAIYSTDCVNWTETTLPITGSWSAITYNDDKFVAICSNSNVAAYSTDGISWTECIIPVSDWKFITYGQNKFVAVGNSTAVAISTDGINWTDSVGYISDIEGTDITENIKSLVTNGFASEAYVDSAVAGLATETYVDEAVANATATLTPVTTAGTGSAYTATISGITSLTAGTTITIVPHVVSASTTPTLDVNGLGAKQIRRRLSTIATSAQAGYTSTWLAANQPFTLVYDGTYWIVEGMEKPVAADLYGTLSVEKGGTGATDAATALTNLGAQAKLTGVTGQVVGFDANGNAIAQEAASGMPSVTTADNGKFLRVVDGVWAATTVPSAKEVAF